MDWLASAYPWIKACHILSVIAWMAGLLYLPRLFVYHAGTTPGSEASETFKVMERRLLRGIMNPAMVATWSFGLLLVAASGLAALSAGWLHVKLALVIGLTVLHRLMASWRHDFEQDRNPRSARFYRFINEVPTLLMIGIVIMAVVKPF